MPQIDDLARDAGHALDCGRPEEALALLDRALQVAREHGEIGAIGWLVAHRGFAHGDLGKWLAAEKDLTQSILYGMLGNPFVHLKRGIALYELGEHEEAKNELFKAVVIDGPSVFAEEAPRYWDFAIQGMRLPAGCEDWTAWSGCEPGSEMFRGICDPAHYRLFAPSMH